MTKSLRKNKLKATAPVPDNCQTKNNIYDLNVKPTILGPRFHLFYMLIWEKWLHCGGVGQQSDNIKTSNHIRLTTSLPIPQG